ncbi:unnamed protein product [Aphis gossypii]|uniref:Uncharacterized protein n=1 Tax=Aphis gossypii TaxID=80765 RepID=A0A9P0J5W4_APHGO|nr:unnamed protein product [Aphis gossypii]
MTEESDNADKPLTMKLDDQVPPAIHEIQLLLPADEQKTDGDGAEAGDGEQKPLAVSDGGAGCAPEKEKYGPWPGKKFCTSDQAAGVNGMPRCTQPRSDDNPVDGDGWNSDEENDESGCNSCAWSCWVCVYSVLSCCAHPCK